MVFQIFVEIEMTRNENRLFGRLFETVQIFFLSEIRLSLVYTGNQTIKEDFNVNGYGQSMYIAKVILHV